MLGSQCAILNVCSMCALGPPVRKVGYSWGCGLVMWCCGGGCGVKVAAGTWKYSLNGLCVKGILDCNKVKRRNVLW